MISIFYSSQMAHDLRSQKRPKRGRSYAKSHRLHVKAQRLIALSSLLMTSAFIGCGPGMTHQAATDILLKQLTQEEVVVLKTCRDLEAQSPEQLSSVLDDPAVPMYIKEELLHEVRFGLGAKWLRRMGF